MVRDAIAGDAPMVAAIGQVAFPALHENVLDEALIELIVAQTYSVDALRECIVRCAQTGEAHFLVAERDGALVGYLHYDSAGAEPELHRMYVDPARKRTGIGAALVREHHARLPPGSSYILKVLTTNEPAIGFYRRHGLKEQARIDAFAGSSDYMGVRFSSRTRPLTVFIMRFTNTG